MPKLAAKLLSGMAHLETMEHKLTTATDELSAIFAELIGTAAERNMDVVRGDTPPTTLG